MAGLNCAEAVNFAPADWLPHGGFGAELYRLYHKVPVLSHEELLCVVAKVCNTLVLLHFSVVIYSFWLAYGRRIRELVLIQFLRKRFTMIINS